MNMDRLNNWLTLLANVGVMIGLIVVVFEVRESNRQTTSAANIARYNEIETAFRDFALSDHLPGIYVVIEESGVSALSREQLGRVRSWELARIMRMEGQFVQYHDGYLDEKGYELMLNAARQSAPLWKELGIQSLYPAFRDAVNSDDDV